MSDFHYLCIPGIKPVKSFCCCSLRTINMIISIWLLIYNLFFCVVYRDTYIYLVFLVISATIFSYIYYSIKFDTNLKVYTHAVIILIILEFIGFLIIVAKLFTLDLETYIKIINLVICVIIPLINVCLTYFMWSFAKYVLLGQIDLVRGNFSSLVQPIHSGYNNHI